MLHPECQKANIIYIMNPEKRKGIFDVTEANSWAAPLCSLRSLILSSSKDDLGRRVSA